MGRGSLSDTARVACADQVNRALYRSALLGIPSSALLALILGSSVPTSRRVAFVAFVCVADVVTFIAAGAYLRRRKRGETVRRYWVGPCCTALISLAWGSLAVIGMPDARHVDLRAVYLLFVCGASATYVVGAAARRVDYFTSQIPMLTLITVAFVSSGDRTTRLLGFAVPIYFAVMTALHHEVHSVVISELQLRERNDDANARLREANTTLARQAQRDELTGLANRAAFMDQLQRALHRSSLDAGVVAVLYIDVDRFKVVNDSLGHGAGDTLLVEVARRITDIAPTCQAIARFGGDEFTILCDGLAGEAEAVRIAERVAAAFSAPFRLHGRTVNISASIGVATTLDESTDASTLVSHADAAQYRAKQAGRNRIEVFDLALREVMLRRLDDEQQLRDGITNGQILAWYQPLMDLHTGRSVGAEALARWQHPAHGVLDAYRFVPLAEETGLILALDDRIVESAVGACTDLASDGVGTDFRIWCNVSPNQFARSGPTERLANLLDQAGCDPRLIGVEITETAVLQDIGAAAREIAAARDMGITVALDDFGIGHSSLTLLRSLPIDKVKIDQSFVRDLTREHRDVAIVRSVIALANDLGIGVVAEGVETPEQAHLLRQLGCRYAQGFLWAKALPIDRLAEHLRATNSTPSLVAGAAAASLVPRQSAHA